MKNLFFILTFGAVATVAYFQGNGSCAFAAPENASATGLIAKPSDISTEPQPNVPAGWITDFMAALQQAKAENKTVLIKFTGSDWCGLCQKLDAEVFTQAAFKDYAKDNLVLVYLDFPVNKPQTDALASQNEELATKLRVQGMPTVVLLDGDGKYLGNTGYRPIGPEKYVEHLKDIISPKGNS